MNSQQPDRKLMESYRYNLTTISPLHIGTGESMMPLEYYLGDRLIVPDIEKVLSTSAAVSEKFSRNLSARAAHELNSINIDQLIDRSLLVDESNWRYALRQIDKKDAYYFAFNWLLLEMQPDKRSAGKNNGEVRLAIKNSDYRPYIPGTSIKGALRTAWAYQEALEDQQLFERLGKSERANSAHQDLNSQIFQSSAHQFNAIYDLFRIVQVGDSDSQAAAESLCLVAERVLSANVRATGKTGATAKFKEYWVYCEAIYRKVEFNGRLQIDRKLLEHNYAQEQLRWKPRQSRLSMESLRAAVNRFSLDLIDWEISYFNNIIQNESDCNTEQVLKFYQEQREKVANAASNELYLCLGHGAGWHKMTLGTLLEKNLPKGQFERLRTNLKMAERHTDFEYPKSRKLSMSGRIRASRPLGWCKLVLNAE